MTSAVQNPANLLTLAQRGRHDEAAAVAKEALGDQRTTPLDRLGLLYGLTCAELFAGRLSDAERAATACDAEAARLGTLGWRANALAIRAMIREVNGAHEDALDDAIEAEVLLEACEDPGLRNWCYSGLGSVYTALRLYELALPHFTAATETPEQAVDYADGEVVDHYNLADLYLRWSRELERVGLDDPIRRREHTEHLAEAQRWIDSGTALVGDRESWRTGFDRMRAQAASTTDPRAALDELERLRKVDLAEQRHDDAVQSTSALARAHRMLGDLAAAQRIGAEAVDLLSSGPVNEQTTTLDAYFQLHMAQHAAGLPGSDAVAGYVRMSTHLLWEQRTRTVDGVRARRDLAVLQHDHAVSSRLAREDPLTRLANRRAIDEWLQTHTTGPAALVLMDLDGFKAINDTHGHPTGDKVLMRVAAAIRSSARGSDLAARFGGDEFVVMVKGLLRDVGAVARRLADAVGAVDISDLGIEGPVSVTVGTASVGPGESTHVLLDEADRLLLTNKRRRSA